MQLITKATLPFLVLRFIAFGHSTRPNFLTWEEGCNQNYCKEAKPGNFWLLKNLDTALIAYWIAQQKTRFSTHS